MRASVALSGLKTLWFNTGSLCNITCKNCYMHSSPKNDDLTYLKAAQVQTYLDEIAAQALPVQEIGFTGGEPFMNPHIIDMLDRVLGQGLKALVLTNAMKPLHQKRAALQDLVQGRGGEKLKLRISVDHYTQQGHEKERGDASWGPMVEGIMGLIEDGFAIDVAGRTLWTQTQDVTRKGYQRLFDAWGLAIDAFDPAHLVLFPEMDETCDVPEITTSCWGLLDVRPDAMMCATSRMVVLRKGEPTPHVVPCTLLPYEEGFQMGERLIDAQNAVQLNHPHCAKFCVLGGASCSVDEPVSP